MNISISHSAMAQKSCEIIEPSIIHIYPIFHYYTEVSQCTLFYKIFFEGATTESVS